MAVKVEDMIVDFIQCLVTCIFPLTYPPMFHVSQKNIMVQKFVTYVSLPHCGMTSERCFHNEDSSICPLTVYWCGTEFNNIVIRLCVLKTVLFASLKPEQEDIRPGYGVKCHLIKLILHLTELCDPCPIFLFFFFAWKCGPKVSSCRGQKV